MKQIISILLSAIMLTGCMQSGSASSQLDVISSCETSLVSESNVPSDTASASVFSSSSRAPLSNDELLEQLKSGDVSNVLVEREYPDIEAFERACSSVMGVYKEWFQYDVNNDGFDDLILQDTDEYNTGLQSIIAIFSAESGKIRCHVWDENDASEFYFVAKNGNVIYCAPYYGTFELDFYKHYSFDKEWNQIFEGGIMLYGIYDYKEVDSEQWREDHPDITTEGIYYYDMVPLDKKNDKGADNKKVKITKEQFKEKFKTILGVPFEEMKPWWIEEWDFK